MPLSNTHYLVAGRNRCRYLQSSYALCVGVGGRLAAALDPTAARYFIRIGTEDWEKSMEEHSFPIRRLQNTHTNMTGCALMQSELAFAFGVL